MSDFVTPIARAFSDAILPIRVGFSSTEEVEAFLARYGWEVSVASGNMNAINTAFAFEPLIVALAENLDELINGTSQDRLYIALQLLEAAKGTAEQLSNLAPGGSGGLAAPLDQASFWSELSALLVDDLIATYLEKHQPILFGVLHVSSVIRFEQESPNGPNRIPFMRTRIVWDNLADLLVRPADLLNDYYKWDVAGQQFDHQRFLRSIERALLAFRLPASVSPPREGLATDYLNPANIAPQNINELEAPIVNGVNLGDNTWLKLGVVLLPIPDPPASNNAPRGILLSPILQGDLTVTLPIAEGIGLKFSGGIDSSSTIVAMIYPDRAGFESNLTATTFNVAVELGGRPAQPFLLFGSRTSDRLELDGFQVILGLRGTVADPEIFFGIGTGDNSKLRSKVLLGGDQGDGFVQKLSGTTEGIEVELGANFLWSSKRGVSFEGSAGLDFVKYLHLALGPISLEMIHIRAAGGNDGLRVDLGVGLKGSFGPLVALVEDIGLRLSLVPVTGGRGAFGNLDLQFGFKPPNGVGLSIDAGVVKGGGYLFIDADRGEYAGALELGLFEVVTIKAIGLITTKMPDGSKGFSLLIMMSVEFGTGIQLGFGFTLLAVGGLLGLNRTMKLQALADGIRSGAIESVMFPRDLIANAPRIISDLKAFFPLLEGTFLIGPMVKLGWGTPTLVSVSLGVIIEIPGNIAIVGILQVALPTADAALIKLQVNFIGAIEFDKKRIWFFAALFDSRVLFLTIEGEMGLLVAFGDDANFVVSVGGFHPRFSPPPLPFPSPRRIAISILNTPVARVRVEGYFAVTSNTVQFGARVEVFFGLDVINVQGHLAFDALFQFSPFYFVIEISASLSVNVFGIGLFSVSLRGSLEGPAPWHIEGHGSITLLFFDIGVDFSETWGENKKEELPPISVLTLIDGELGKAENWRAFLPQGTSLMVSMRKMSEEEAALILHPVGLLRISQRAVPLDLKLDKIGSRKPSDVNRLSLTVIGGGLAKKADALEQFAPAQYQNFKDADKLSKPAFAPEHAGLDLSASGHDTRSSFMVRRAIRYEEIIIDSNFKRFSMRFRGYFGVLFNFFLNGAAVTKCEISRATKKKLQPFDDKIAVQTESYTVAFQSNNKAFSSDATTFHSEASARDYLNNQIAVDPSLAEQIHVIPSFEKAA
mgnify:CR=1 FL=1